MAKYNIGGYIFDDENKAKKAAKELKSVEYILAQLKDADEVKAFKQYLDKLFISMDYEHAPRFQLISRKYWQDYEETTNEISKKAIRELYGLKGDQIYCVTEPRGYGCGYADSEEDAQKMAAKLGIKDYKITLV